MVLGLPTPSSLASRARVAMRRDTTLGTLLGRLASVNGTRRLATEQGGLELTFAQAAVLVDRWAGGVRTRCRPGERVVVHLPNGYGQFLACLAVARAGCVAVPVNPQMRDDEVRHVTEDSGAAFVLTDPAEVAGRPALGAAHPAAPGDVAAIFYTSGTTGRPKGARLTHHGLLGDLAWGALVPAMPGGHEAVVALPVAHIMGFVALAGLACSGVPVYTLPRFRPLDVLDALEHRRAAAFIGVPAMYRMLLDAGAESRDLSSVRVWASGADVMPADLARRFQAMGATARIPGVGGVGSAAFVEGYGMVELSGAVAFKVHPPHCEGLLARALPAAPLLRRAWGDDALGVPLPGWRLRVVDEHGREVPVGRTGELVVKGPGVLEGYHGDEAATALLFTDDGWMRTGDLAVRGPGRAVRFAGRAKDVVKVGGYSVYALEVERVLRECDAVAEAAVVGIPDERLGEVPVAAVRLAPGAVADEAVLIAHCRAHLADYKVPRRVVVVDDLPRTGTAKVRKAQLVPLFI